MPKTLLAGMTTHIGNEVTTLSLCAHVTRTDGDEFFFTNHDANITFAADSYEAESGFQSSALATRSDLGVDNTEIKGFIFDSGTLLEEDLRDGYFDFAECEFFYVNWQDPDTDGALKMKRAIFGEVEIIDGKFSVELRGLNQLLRRRIGEKYSPTCRADVFDSGGANRCKLDPDTFIMPQTLLAAKRLAIVESVTSNREFVVGGNLTSILDPDEDTVEQHRVQISATDVATLVLGPEDGTPLRPFQITTSADLEAIPDSATGYYVLTANVDMSGAAESPFVPIDDFQGVFDGLGFEIQTIDLDRNLEASKESAIFTNLAGTVKRVGVTDSTVRSDASTLCAPLASSIESGGVVEDCFALGGSVTTDADFAGGLVGIVNSGGTLQRCVSAVSMSGGGTDTGGIVGNSNAGGTYAALYFDGDRVGTPASPNTAQGAGTPASQTVLDRTTAHLEATYTGLDLNNDWDLAVIFAETSIANVTFTDVPSPDTIARAAGDFTTDFTALDRVQVSGTTSNDSTGLEIAAAGVATLTLTLDAAETLTTEGPISATLSIIDYPRLLDPGRC